MLEFFLAENGLKAELLRSKDPDPKSPEGLCRELGLALSQLVHTFLFVGKNPGEAVLCVIEYNSMPDSKKLEAVSGIEWLQPATTPESMEITGFENNFIPPVSVYGIKTFISKSLAKKKELYSSAGDGFSLLKISLYELKEYAFEAEFADVK